VGGGLNGKKKIVFVSAWGGKTLLGGGEVGSVFFLRGGLFCGEKRKKVVRLFALKGGVPLFILWGEKDVGGVVFTY